MTGQVAMLLVDAGNTRIKWGLHVEGRWAGFGALPTAEAGRGLAAAWAELAPRPRRIVVSNVAGAGARDAIEVAATALGTVPTWFASSPACAGVTSRYDEPRQLGSDRWAALIGARRRCPGDCVVVNSGTAITVDCLTATGVFLGGIIVPGVELMLDALAGRAAGLSPQRGHFRPYPRNTPDAMTSGALIAAAGAVDGMVRRFGRDLGGTPPILLSGGAGAALVPHIEASVELVEHLVLEGLVVAQAELPR